MPEGNPLESKLSYNKIQEQDFIVKNFDGYVR